MTELANLPLISIITPMYNSALYINQTIDSVVKQTYPKWEMLIVDDCSTDGSAEIVLNRVKLDNRIKYYQLGRNFGAPYAARNFGTERAQGKYVAFLDSDDLWNESKLERQLLFMQEKNIEISFTGYSKLYESNSNKKKTIHVPPVVQYKNLLKTNHIGCLTAMYDVSKTGKLYQPGPRFHEDYIMWLQILKKGFKAYGLNEVLACYRVHNKSISTNKFKMAKVTWDIYRKEMELGLFTSIWYFLHYSINGFRKI